MARLIDADALIKKFQSDKEYFDKVGDTTFAMATIGVINDIDKAPTIDAVSVVRCRECKYWIGHLTDDDGFDGEDECRWRDSEAPNADDYCSYGEREGE